MYVSQTSKYATGLTDVQEVEHFIWHPYVTFRAAVIMRLALKHVFYVTTKPHSQPQKESVLYFRTSLASCPKYPEGAFRRSCSGYLGCTT